MQLSAQNEFINPVKWNSTTTEIDTDEFDLFFEATIDSGWYLYSQLIAGDGPIATSINFDETIELFNDYAIEISEFRSNEHDEMFDMQLIKYQNKLILNQKIKNIENHNTISGHIEFMCCNDVQCIFPEPYQFTLNLKK